MIPYNNTDFSPIEANGRYTCLHCAGYGLEVKDVKIQKHAPICPLYVKEERLPGIYWVLYDTVENKFKSASSYNYWVDHVTSAKLYISPKGTPKARMTRAIREAKEKAAWDVEALIKQKNDQYAKYRPDYSVSAEEILRMKIERDVAKLRSILPNWGYVIKELKLVEV